MNHRNNILLRQRPSTTYFATFLQVNLDHHHHPQLQSCPEGEDVKPAPDKNFFQRTKRNHFTLIPFYPLARNRMFISDQKRPSKGPTLKNARKNPSTGISVEQETTCSPPSPTDVRVINLVSVPWHQSWRKDKEKVKVTQQDFEKYNCGFTTTSK